MGHFTSIESAIFKNDTTCKITGPCQWPDTKKTRLTIVITTSQVKLENAMKIAWRTGSERRVGFEPFYKYHFLD